ncbi:hypothetical protein EDC01DRAFT_476541 [Geopyxis carbonaria]|nr:hypothetical protein EDC01DRAFT_476541 [Geopyxis carbonaria]
MHTGKTKHTNMQHIYVFACTHWPTDMQFPVSPCYAFIPKRLVFHASTYIALRSLRRSVVALCCFVFVAIFRFSSRSLIGDRKKASVWLGHLPLYVVGSDSRSHKRRCRHHPSILPLPLPCLHHPLHPHLAIANDPQHAPAGAGIHPSSRYASPFPRPPTPVGVGCWSRAAATAATPAPVPFQHLVAAAMQGEVSSWGGVPPYSSASGPSEGDSM